MEALSKSLQDLICWIFSPKRVEALPLQGGKETPDQEARRLRVAWSYFDN